MIDFFAAVSSEVSCLDFSQIQLSQNMFIQIAFKVTESFPSLIEARFANLDFSSSALNGQMFTSTSEAILNLLNHQTISKLSFLNCSFSGSLINLILQLSTKISSSSSFHCNISFFIFNIFMGLKLVKHFIK